MHCYTDVGCYHYRCRHATMMDGGTLGGSVPDVCCLRLESNGVPADNGLLKVPLGTTLRFELAPHCRDLVSVCVGGRARATATPVARVCMPVPLRCGDVPCHGRHGVRLHAETALPRSLPPLPPGDRSSVRTARHRHQPLPTAARVCGCGGCVGLVGVRPATAQQSASSHGRSAEPRGAWPLSTPTRGSPAPTQHAHTHAQTHTNVHKRTRGKKKDGHTQQHSPPPPFCGLGSVT